MRSLKHDAPKLFLICALAAALSSCGGGSSGTGVPDSFVSKTIDGNIVDDQNQPVANAKVTITETGASQTTGSNGAFEFEVEGDMPINLQVDADGVQDTVPITTTSDQSTRVNVKISISRKTGAVSTNNLEVLAKIVGACDFAFENSSTIRQGNKLADGTTCPLMVTVRSSAGGLSGVTFRIERSRCDTVSWHLVGQGQTGNDGTGTIQFQYRDNDDFCQYRIIAPYNVSGLPNTIFPVDTFREQAFEKQ